MKQELLTQKRLWLFLVALGVVLAIVLAAMGRIWWCEQGDLWPWSWDVWSPHNSQHLVDPYSLSHLGHGLMLYLLLSLTLRQLTVNWRIAIVAVVEVVWEITENSSWLIQRYRENTASLDYFGDSIVNSLGDYLSCLLGIGLAVRLPAWATVSLFVLLELISLVWIRDNLTLNILMLLYPIEAIREWQTPAS